MVKSVDGMSSAPWAIVDDTTSDVLLFWNQNSTAKETCSCGVAMVRGKDGADYSSPVWLPASSGVVGSSLDAGIRLRKGPHAGRLLVCMRKICKNSCHAPYQAFTAYSDDGAQNLSPSKTKTGKSMRGQLNYSRPVQSIRYKSGRGFA
eukprot:COSAG06_NODE_7169_length_2600_cov_13.115954_3_plen_148_part_00